MKIRRMQNKDLSQILRISQSVNEFDVSESVASWSRSQLSKWINSRKDVCLVIEDGKAMAGFALSAVHVPTGKVTFENLWIHPKFRGKGVASSLVKELLLRLKKKNYTYIMGFSSLERSELNFLTKNGFVMGKRGVWIDKLL